MKKKKILLIIIAIIVLLYIISVIYKLSILNKIIKTNANTLANEDNLYYFLQGNNHNEEYWRNGNIIKAEITKNKNDSPEIILWKDYSINNGYTFIPSSKTYSTSTVGLAMHNSQLASYSTKFTVAILPICTITSKEYKKQKCYSLKMLSITEYINKETGLLVYSKSDDDEFNIKYSFDTVTDKDVQSPNIEEYTLQ